MSRGSAGGVIVAELVSAGRGAAAQPAFEPGHRIPLAKGARGEAEVGDLVTVTLRGRSGRVTGVHGPASSPRAALRALLASEDLGRPFPRAVIAEAERADEAAAAADRGRRDLRGQRVVTIDPEGAKDHDDALAIAPERDGSWRLWVHIADVARFVTGGGALDREAARRGCSVYVPGAVDPMLPPRLSADVCSLRPGADRAAVTVEMVVTPDGTVGEVRFGRSLIRSERRLTYPEVDRALTGERPLEDEALQRDVAALAAVARWLGARRVARGALEASSAEPVVRFDGDRVASIELEGQTPAHSLVEECMIAANEAVARHLIARGRQTVFRHHEDPSQSRVEMLYAQLEALEVATPPLPGGPLGGPALRAAVVAAADAVGRHIAAGRGPDALWTLVLRALKQAYYSPTERTHSGLASPAYLHFTSPIRRYPDLLVHRGLLETLGIDGPGPEGAELAVEAERSSAREREAAAVERRGDDICAAYWLSDRLGERGWDQPVEGVVTGVIDAGLFVTFEGGIVTGFLPARRLEDDHYRADPLGVMLIGSSTGRRIRLGDRIGALVVRVEPLRGRVELWPADAPRSLRPRPARAVVPRSRRGRSGAAPRGR